MMFYSFARPNSQLTRKHSSRMPLPACQPYMLHDEQVWTYPRSGTEPGSGKDKVPSDNVSQIGTYSVVQEWSQGRPVHWSLIVWYNASWVVVTWTPPPSVQTDWQTHTIEKITIPATSLAGCKYTPRVWHHLHHLRCLLLYINNRLLLFQYLSGRDQVLSDNLSQIRDLFRW